MSGFLSFEGLQVFKGKLDEIYGASLTVSGQTVKLISKSGTVLGSGTIGIPSYDDVTNESSGLMLAADKKKLDGISEGANKVTESATNGNILVDGSQLIVYTHPTQTPQTSGLYKITVDGTGHVTAVTAVAKADITALGIPAQDTTYADATQSAGGLMSAGDKAKLDGITSSATFVAASSTNGNILINGTQTVVYSHPTYTERTSAFNKFSVDGTGHVNAVSAVTKQDITALGIPAQDTTYSPASASADGLMAKADKAKLDTVAEDADANVLESVKVNGVALSIADKAVNIDLSNYATKDMISQAVNYRGSVDNYADLPTSAVSGDMYNVVNADADNGILAGDNVVFNGTSWDVMGGLFTIDPINDQQIESLFA